MSETGDNSVDVCKRQIVDAMRVDVLYECPFTRIWLIIVSIKDIVIFAIVLVVRQRHAVSYGTSQIGCT